MTLKEFGEEATIGYITNVYVNGELAGTISNLSEESHLEDFRKLDHAISNQIKEQFEALPENQEED